MCNRVGWVGRGMPCSRDLQPFMAWPQSQPLGAHPPPTSWVHVDASEQQVEGLGNLMGYRQLAAPGWAARAHRAWSAEWDCGLCLETRAAREWSGTMDRWLGEAAVIPAVRPAPTAAAVGKQQQNSVTGLKRTAQAAEARQHPHHRAASLLAGAAAPAAHRRRASEHVPHAAGPAQALDGPLPAVHIVVVWKGVEHHEADEPAGRANGMHVKRALVNEAAALVRPRLQQLHSPVRSWLGCRLRWHASPRPCGTAAGALGCAVGRPGHGVMSQAMHVHARRRLLTP